MGLATLKISERCAYSFPTCAPAARVAHTVCFRPRRQIAGSRKMEAAVARFLWRARGGRGVASSGHWNAAHDRGGRAFGSEEGKRVLKGDGSSEITHTNPRMT